MFRALKANINPNIKRVNGMAMEKKGARAGSAKRGGTFAPPQSCRLVPLNMRQPMVHSEKLPIEAW